MSPWEVEEPDEREVVEFPAKEFQADFETADHSVDKASTERRPDAVSLDYLRAFSFGPTALQDPSAGLLDRAWYVRATGSAVFVAKANDDGDAWEAEQELFTYTGEPILEVDIAFTQNADTVVVTERATGAGGGKELWIYYFNPTLGAEGEFTFENFGEGRTPRVFLDDPQNEEDSDVVVIYIDDTNSEMRMRVQNDRYQTPESIPLATTEHHYIEDLLKNVGRRLGIIYSIRDTGTGTYSIAAFWSKLYPLFVFDGLDFVSRISSVNFRHALGTDAVDEEGVDFSSSILAAEVKEPLITVSSEGPDFFIDIEGLDFESSIAAAEFIEAIIVSADGPDGYVDEEGLDFEASIGVAEFVEAIINTVDEEGLDFANSIASASLATP